MATHPVSLPGKSHGQRSLVGCSPWVAKTWTWLSDFTFIPSMCFGGKFTSSVTDIRLKLVKRWHRSKHVAQSWPTGHGRKSRKLQRSIFSFLRSKHSKTTIPSAPVGTLTCMRSRNFHHHLPTNWGRDQHQERQRFGVNLGPWQWWVALIISSGNHSTSFKKNKLS